MNCGLLSGETGGAFGPRHVGGNGFALPFFLDLESQGAEFIFASAGFGGKTGDANRFGSATHFAGIALGEGEIARLRLRVVGEFYGIQFEQFVRGILRCFVGQDQIALVEIAQAKGIAEEGAQPQRGFREIRDVEIGRFVLIVDDASAAIMGAQQDPKG